MDKSGHIGEHGREKLFVYEEYLKRYLSVLTNLTNSKYFKNILICEPFAGKGISDNDVEGSALRSAKIIDKTLKDKNGLKGLKIHLWLNDKNAQSCQELSNHLSEFSEFVKIYNHEANQFLPLIIQSIKNYDKCFMFIDPFGYTDVKIDILGGLLRIEKLEILIFVPTSSILRFIKKENIERSVIINFIDDVGLDHQQLQKCKGVSEFIKIFIARLKELSHSRFVYDYELKNKSAIFSLHCIFFITHNIKGAEKFLETQRHVTKQLAKLFEQLLLFDTRALEKEEKITTELKEGKTNTQLYEWGIENGYLPGDINPVLKELEKNNIIVVNTISGERKKKGFYIKDNPQVNIYLKQKN